MGLIVLRFLAIFYVVGILVLIVSFCSKAIIEKRRTFLGVFLFPILLFTKDGRSFLNKVIKGDLK